MALVTTAVGIAVLPLVAVADRRPAIMVLIASALAGGWIATRAWPVLAGPLLTIGALTAQTSYVVVTGDADSPFLSGFLLIVLVVGVTSPPGRTVGAALLAGAGLFVTAVADRKLAPEELLTVVTTFGAILLSGVTFSWLGWRRRRWMRRASRRASRARELVRQRVTESRTDPLTGLANRRAFEEDLRARLAVAGPGGVGLLYADLDNLKVVNDDRGHDAGDRMLRAVGDAFAACLRARERVYRIGGDEFVAIVRAEDLHGLAERLGTRLEIDVDGLGAVSASIGMISGRPGDGTTDLLRRADRAMYRSKRAHAAASA
ncbi:MAG: GGDEF domain-containing protein [Candidatus Limnocylindrales bacterium]